MGVVTAKRGTWSSWIAFLGILCIALILVTGIVQLTHSHSSGQIDHDCALCFTAHQAIQLAVIVAILVVSLPVTRLPRIAFIPAPRQRLILKLANRPPPSSSAISA